MFINLFKFTLIIFRFYSFSIHFNSVFLIKDLESILKYKKIRLNLKYKKSVILILHASVIWL